MPPAVSRYSDNRPVRMEVVGLFDRFTHRIPMPSAEQPVRFLSAPNGYGKSTALRIIDDLARGQWRSLASTYFASTTLEFESGGKLTVSRSVTPKGYADLFLSLQVPGRPEITNRIAAPNRKEASLDDLPNWIRRIGPSEYRNLRTGEQLSADDLVRALDYSTDLEPGPSDAPLAPEILHALRRLSVFYLDAQRLRTTIREESLRRSMHTSSPETENEYSINEISSRVAQILRRARFEYGQAGRTAERTFPARVLRALSNPGDAAQVTPRLLEERFTRLRQEEEHLQSLSLTDGMMDDIRDDFLHAETTALAILAQYLDDIEERFGLLEQTARQLTLFRDTLNGMLEEKAIRFTADTRWGRNRQSGLEVIATDGRPIPLTALSSGEQHLVVMFGRILFQSRLHRGGLVLLDEPEISLHPQWQIALSRALKQVAVVNDCRMLLATHSPTMIDNDWDNEIDLTVSGEA
jgi:energy-coupling factor transporter ATP-binding protein EcfA2